jgi:hypothetical protein
MSRCRAADSSSETAQTPKPVRGKRPKWCLLAEAEDEDEDEDEDENENEDDDNDDRDDRPQKHLQAGDSWKIANTDWLAHALCSSAPCTGDRIGPGATAGWWSICQVPLEGKLAAIWALGNPPALPFLLFNPSTLQPSTLNPQPVQPAHPSLDFAYECTVSQIGF